MSAAHCGLGGEASVDKSKHLVHRVAQVAHGLAQGKVPCTVHAIPVLLVFVHILVLKFVFVLVLGTAPCVSNVPLVVRLNGPSRVLLTNLYGDCFRG